MSVVARYTFGTRPRYEGVVIDFGGRTWIRLTKVGDPHLEHLGGDWVRVSLVRFWSTKPELDDAKTPMGVLTALRDRLDAADGTLGGEDEALLFWPQGWDCWGSGIPEPVADYVTYGFDDELSKVVPTELRGSDESHSEKANGVRAVPTS